uniref:RNA-directed RNA polymerase L n=1 Tax=Phytophthora palustris bunya-like virus 1 TaxID=2976274 RepID=A0A9E8Z077_9VIRU|nr:RNA-dependent RNA polymerase [Phytophthora palustris bunya-like virus 1]
MLVIRDDIPKLSGNYDIIPIHVSPYTPWKIVYQDAGGAGDCLIRSLYRCFGALPGFHSVYYVSQIYEKLGKQPGQYLEDDDIVQLVQLFGINLLVIRVNVEVDFILYNTGVSTCLTVLNFYPNHFCPVLELYELGSKTQTKFDLNSLENRDRHLNNTVLPEFKNLLQGATQLHMAVLDNHPTILGHEGQTIGPQDLYSFKTLKKEPEPKIPSEDSDSPYEVDEVSSDDDFQEQPNEPFSAPASNANLSTIYAYFCDSSEMCFPDPNALIETFAHVHNIFVRLLLRLNEDLKYPDRSLITMYYKFRHNVFSNICNYSLQGKMVKLETDVPLSKWIPESNKTPDLVIEDEYEIVIYEFTVGNSYGRVDYLKGGGAYALKYSDEASLISAATKKKTKVVIIPAVLDSYNVEEICKLLGSNHLYRDFSSFFEISNEYKSVITTNMMHSSRRVTVEPPQATGLQLYPRTTGSQIVMLPHEAASGMITQLPGLTSRLEAANPKRLFQIRYDLKNNSYFMDDEKRGKSPEYWMSILQPDLSLLLDTVYLSNGSRKKVSFSEFTGTIPVTIKSKRKMLKLKPWYNTPSFESVYTRESPAIDPGFSRPTVFDDALCYRLDDDQKVYFPPDYMQNLCTMDLSDLMNSDSHALLANCRMDEQEISRGIELFNRKLESDNVLDTVRTKPTFIFGLPTKPLHFDEIGVPHSLIEAYLKFGKGLYTKTILRKANDGQFATSRTSEFSSEVRSLFNDYHDANSTYYRKMYEVCGSLVKRDLQLPEQKNTLEPHFKRLNTTRKAYQQALGKGKKVISDRLVRVNSKGVNEKEFEREMLHYKRKEGRSGLGIPNDTDALLNYFQKLIYRLRDNKFCDISATGLYEQVSVNGSDFLKVLKQASVDRYDAFCEKHLTGTMLYQGALYYERLASFLFNESLKTYGNDYIKIDNLGFDNVLVMCRGGAKLYKHQRSRLYRVMFPLDPVDIQMQGFLENDSFEKINHQGILYIMTPWSQVHQDILFDYMFATGRLLTQLFSITARVDSTLSNPLESLAILPVMLMFHNRRKTEKFLHNSRYLIVNPLGSMANLSGIMSSFSDINYTYLEAWLRSRLSKHYMSFAKGMLVIRDSKKKRLADIMDQVELKDLWFGQPLTSPDLLTLFIYSTYMMTKAPVNSSIEQATNLWEILEDIEMFSSKHSDVEFMNDKSLRMDVTKFDIDVYEDDFKYDPVYCQYLGHYMQSYLNPLISYAEVDSKWETLLHSDIDTIANSNGLRGYNRKNFFNRKGYDIVYSKIDEMLTDEEIQNRILHYLESEQTTCANSIQADRFTFEESQQKYEQLVFHIVHKIQRGGSREIFCMDFETKVKQHPIEQLFSFICKRVPNEFISVPSSRRHGRIHTDFYEKKISPWVKKVVRWVMDCRRWAPHSVFQKYVHFVSGLAPLLPSSFLTHFYKFAEGMTQKLFVTRQHVVSKMMKNKKFEKYQHLVKQCNRASDALSMTVSFSFVMGIFNYLSTLMHAANQLVASEVIRAQCLNRNLGVVLIDAKCHSDDSVASSYHEDEESIHLSVKLYDWMLKAANHMLSVKKSQINNDVYLEFLSTLYLVDRFLPVFPKFTSTIPFKPTDEGYCSDISFAASQAIEMLTMGGTLEESYLIMKVAEKKIRKIYNFDAVLDMPPQLLGVLDAHPVELLISGSNADLYNFYTYNNKKFWSTYMTLNKSGLIDLDQAELSLSWDMGAFLDSSIRSRLKKLNPIVEKLSVAEWTMNNCKLGNSTLNLVWYYLKMNDRKFRSSLVDEPVARKMSRIFGASGYRNIKTNTGEILSVYDMLAVLKKVPMEIDTEIPISTDSFLAFMSDSLKTFHDSLIGSEITAIEPSGFKEKPITINLGGNKIGSNKMSASEYVSYKKEPKGYLLLGKYINPAREAESLTADLTVFGVDVDLLTADQLYQVVRRLTGKTSNMYRIIAPTPSGVRYLDSYSHLLTLIEVATHAHKRLKVKNSAAASIDWNKKMISGRAPKAAIDYMKSFWLCQTLSDYNIIDKDLYLENPRETESLLASQLPDEWKTILLTSVRQRDSALADINHWCYWEREQVKLGRDWVGYGSCVVKIPEATIKLEMSGGSLTKISIYTKHEGLISTASSWYLHSLFSLSSTTIQMFDSSISLPNVKYLGLNARGHIYGFGLAYQFDALHEVVWLEEEPIPLEFYDRMESRRERNHYKYIGESKDYYIDFFIPVEDPINISYQGIFDLDKIKENSEDPDVINFLRKVSVDLGGYMEIEQDYLIDNIGSTTLYNLLYESPQFRAILDNEAKNGVLPESFASWKKKHPDFGYPDEDEMETILKDPESAPFPRKVMDHLFQIGKSNISDIEFQSLILQLSQLDDEGKISLLKNNFGYLDSRMRSDALVVASRSKLVYTSCYFIGVETLRLLPPLMGLLSQCIKEHTVNCPTLMSIKRNLYYSKKISIEPEEILMQVSSRCLLDLVVMGRCDNVPSINTFMSVLGEMWDVGAGPLLNCTTCTDQILRTVDFSVPKEQFLDWVYCLITSLSECHRKITLMSSTAQTLKNSKIDLKPASIFMARMYKHSISHPLSITIRTKKTQKKIKWVEPLWGVTHTDFFGLDEEMQEELKYIFELDAMEDLDTLEPSPIDDLPKVSYTSTFSSDYQSLTSCRGSGQNVYVYCQVLDKTYREVQGEVVIFKKKSRYNNIQTYLTKDMGYIVYMGMEPTRCSIEGYRRLKFEEIIAECKLNCHRDIMIESEGEVYERSTIVKNPVLINRISNLNSFFKRIKESDSDKEIQRVRKIAELIDYDKNPKEAASIAKVTNMLEKSKDPKDTEDEPFNLIDAIKNYTDFLEGMSLDSSSPVKEKLRANYSMFNFTEPLKVMSDLVVTSEFNSLIPHQLDNLLDGRIRLSKKTKDRIVRYAQLEIKTMSRILRKKYSKVLFIIRAVLADVEECNFAQNESLEFAAAIDDIFQRAGSPDEGQFDEIQDLIPDAIEDNIKFDLNKIL